MSFKKLSSVLLIGNFLFLSACGASENVTESTVTEAVQEQTIISEDTAIPEAESISIEENILTDVTCSPQ